MNCPRSPENRQTGADGADVPLLTSATTAAAPRVRDLMERTAVLDATDPLTVLEEGWDGSWTAGSVLVRSPGAPVRHGLVGRDTFVSVTAAGSDRASWAHLPVGRLTRWDAPTVDVDADVTAAAAVLTSAGAYYADLLVTERGRPVGVLAPRTVMLALAALTAAPVQAAPTPHAGVPRPRASYRPDTRALAVVYQPIVAAGTGRLESVEALLRTRRPDGSLGAPGPALTEAADAGAALELDLWVLHEACRAWTSWQATLGARAPRTVHVNLAPQSLVVPDLDARVHAVLAETGTPARAVRLELSECASLDDLHRAGPALHALRAAGAQVALDDLGATLTTLRHMTRLPLDVLKIDRSVVVGMVQDAVDAHIVEAVLRVARERGLEVVAEGVEEPQQLDAVRRRGVGYVQGYLLARPMPADAIASFVG